MTNQRTVRRTLEENIYRTRSSTQILYTLYSTAIYCEVNQPPVCVQQVFVRLFQNFVNPAVILIDLYCLSIKVLHSKLSLLEHQKHKITFISFFHFDRPSFLRHTRMGCNLKLLYEQLYKHYLDPRREHSTKIHKNLDWGWLLDSE